MRRHVAHVGSAGWRPGGASPDPKMGQPLRGTLFAGDVLYIPPLWWHQGWASQGVGSLFVIFSLLASGNG